MFSGCPLNGSPLMHSFHVPVGPPRLHLKGSHLLTLPWCGSFTPNGTVAKTVDLIAICPSSHSSKCIKVRPMALHHALTAWVCQIVEHRLALGLVEQSLGLCGCSKKHQGPGPLYLILEMWHKSSCLSKSSRGLRTPNNLVLVYP